MRAFLIFSFFFVIALTAPAQQSAPETYVQRMTAKKQAEKFSCLLSNIKMNEKLILDLQTEMGNTAVQSHPSTVRTYYYGYYYNGYYYNNYYVTWIHIGPPTLAPTQLKEDQDKIAKYQVEIQGWQEQLANLQAAK